MKINCGVCNNIFEGDVNRKYCSRKCFHFSTKGNNNGFKKNNKPWNKGLTKEEDKRLLNVSKKSRKQMKREYGNGTRDKFKIGIKAREQSQKRMKTDNWLNYESARNALRETMQTEEYKKKQSDLHLGKKNGMFGKKPWNFIDGNTSENSYVYRGFDWKNITKKIKQRDNYTCQKCGRKEEEKYYLQIHHIIPYRISQDNSNDNLITLCSNCHPRMEYKFLKIKSIKQIPKNETVYNISVEKDESYFANQVIVHNCRSTIIFVPDEV